MTAALLKAGVPAMSLQPAASAVCRGGKLVSIAMAPIKVLVYSLISYQVPVKEEPRKNCTCEMNESVKHVVLSQRQNPGTVVDIHYRLLVGCCCTAVRLRCVSKVPDVFENRPIQAALEAGVVPVVHGDVSFDEELGGTVASTEEIFAFLAREMVPG